MKTAMQELIDYLENNSLIDKKVLINKCKILIEKEKQQIINAYKEGVFSFQLAEDYYNEKYQKK
jgi:hypothetical protein